MKFMKREFGDSICHMALLIGFYRYTINIISAKERIVDMDVVKDVTYMRQSVITHVVI